MQVHELGHLLRRRPAARACGMVRDASRTAAVAIVRRSRHHQAAAAAAVAPATAVAVDAAVDASIAVAITAAIATDRSTTRSHRRRPTADPPSQQ